MRTRGGLPQLRPLDDELSATERRAQLILQQLLRSEKISVASLAKRLKVSPTTIRRDLADLEQRGLLRRSHGGAVPRRLAVHRRHRLLRRRRRFLRR